MKKFFHYFIIAATLLISSCSEGYDDSVITNRVNELEDRVTKLEELCKQINTNISALQNIVKALQNNDYVTDISPVSKNGATIGYVISFTKSDPITIYHGENGSTPTISIKQDTDGIYYWAIGGQWLYDANGNKIMAVGTEGITPKLKIENDYWYVSYDNGASWTQLDKATGEDGDSFFQSVTQDDDNVYFTLTDGSSIILPKEAALTIAFENGDLVVMGPNSTHSIEYTITSSTDTVTVEVISSADIKAKIVPDSEDGKYGKIQITTGATVNEYSKVVVFVHNDKKVIMRTLLFEEPGLQVYDTTEKYVAPDGGTVSLEFLTNTECEIIIPESAQQWIYTIAETRTLTQQSLAINVRSNDSEVRRSAAVKVQTLDGSLSLNYTIIQLPNTTTTTNDVIRYTTTDSNAIELKVTEGFGASIVTHSYDKESNYGVIVFANRVTTIPDRAFYIISNLASIDIPSSVTTIGERAFYGCDNMQELTIPKSVLSIGESAFEQCKGVATIKCNIPENGFHKCGFNKAIISDYITQLGAYAFYESPYLTEVNIPSSIYIKAIPDYAFAKCTSLKNIEIEYGITTIGKQAFTNCALEYVKLPESVSQIKERAFEFCSKMHTIDMPKQMGVIEDKAFWKCSSLKEFRIPSGIKVLNAYILHGCTNLAKLSIPASVKESRCIWTYDLDPSCPNLTRLDIEDWDAWCNIQLHISENSFASEYYFSPFLYTNGGDYYVNGEKLTSAKFDIPRISGHVLYGCKDLESVTLTDNVIAIGEGPFYGCRNLKQLDLPNSVSEIGSSAFSGSGITELTFPKFITTIPKWCFFECPNLTSVTIPDIVTLIGDFAFEGCSCLTSITIPDSVTSIGGYAFRNCSSLTSITIGNSVTEIGLGVFENCSSLTSITIPDSVTWFGESAFDNCSSLTSVTIPDSVTSIGGYAFRNCSSLTSITIGNSVTEIGDFAFEGCSCLTSVTIPESVTSIGDSAFDNCSSLTNVNIHISDLVRYCTDGYYYNFIQNKHLFIDGVEITQLTIPDGVTLIREDLFRSCKSLTSITIPDCVTSIEQNAFNSCRGLTSITIGNGVTSIGLSAFKDCISLTSVTIPDNVTSIGKYAFAQCSSLKEIYCKPTTPPTSSASMLDKVASNCTIYVPTASVNKYKSATHWRDYNIIGYDF